MMEWTETVARAAAGQADAIEDLIDRFQDMAVGYAYSILGDFALAEDVAQEAFLQLFRDLATLREPRALPSFLRRIVFKYCDRATRGKRLPTVSLEGAATMPSTGQDPAAALQAKQERSRVAYAIRSLPDTERAVVTLFHIREHSQQEICEFLGITLPSVKNALRSARDLLRDRMLEMVKEELQGHRPSNDEGFSEAIRYFRALEQGDEATVRRLLASNPDLLERRRGRDDPSNDRVTPGMSPLQVAASFGHDGIVAFLLERGADIEARGEGWDPRGRATALHWAAYGRHLSTVDLLLEKGADVGDCQDEDGTGALGVAAVFYDRPEVAQRLVEHGAPVSFWAAIGLDWEARVRELAAADPGLISTRVRGDRLDYTPLHVAANKNLASMVGLLLELGAERDALDGLGRSVIDLALTRGHVASYEALEAAGASPSPALLEVAESVERSRVLNGFIWKCGNDDNLEELRSRLQGDPSLASSIVPNFWPDNYCAARPLHFAAWLGAREVARLLVACGADLTAVDAQYGGTAAGWARENAQSEMAELLDSLG